MSFKLKAEKEFPIQSNKTIDPKKLTRDLQFDISIDESKRTHNKSSSKKPLPSAKPAASSNNLVKGDTIDFIDTDPKSIGNIQVTTDDGKTVTLKQLYEQVNGAAIAIFTYPKASTPGCMYQCLNYL